jgi:hypothetical protein
MEAIDGCLKDFARYMVWKDASGGCTAVPFPSLSAARMADTELSLIPFRALPTALH